jgi:hypothetical protein
MKSTWYVSFEVPKIRKRPGTRISRTTETFQTESEAKEFARAKIRGWTEDQRRYDQPSHT